MLIVRYAMLCGSVLNFLSEREREREMSKKKERKRGIE